MRMTLFSAVAAGALLLAAQAPALAQGAFAYPPNGLDLAPPAAAPAPALRAPSRSGHNSRYYDYYGGTPGYGQTPSSDSQPGFWVPGNIESGR